MDIRIITYLLIILSGLLLAIGSEKHKNFNARKYLIIFICIILAAVSGLRGLSVGPDTLTYSFWFESIKTMPWNYVLDIFYLTYVAGVERDPGFTVFVKLFQVLFPSWQLFLVSIAVFYYATIGVFLYKNTRSIIDVVFAFVLYVSLFQIMSLSAIKQQIATGLVLISLNYIVSKEMFKFFLLILVASQIHISALVMIPFGLSLYLSAKPTKYLYFLAIGLIPIVIIFKTHIVSFLAGLIFFSEYYLGYAEAEGNPYALTYVVLSIAVSIAGLFTIKKKLILRSDKIYYTAIAFMTFFAPLILLDGSLIRLVQYFSLYMMIFIPVSIRSIKVDYHYKLVIFNILIFSLIFLSLRITFVYYFFWQ